MANHIRFIKSTGQYPNLSSAFAQMYKDEALVDVTINVGNQKVQAHRLVLASCSPYFRDMFSKQANPFHYPIVNMEETDFEDLKLVIEFMYRGEVMIPQDRYQDVVRLANRLEIEGFPTGTSAN